MKQYPGRRALCVSAIAVLTTLSSPALAGKIANICAAYDPVAKTLQVKMYTGCISTSAGVIGNDIKLEADPVTGSLTFTGGFQHRKSAGTAVSADCMGGGRVEINIPDIDIARFKVVDNGDDRGELDFSRAGGQQCVRRLGYKPRKIDNYLER